MPGRNYTDGTGYRYGFNGKENDPEVTSTGKGTQDYGLRIYNPSLGRFLSVDPLAREFPWNSSYAFAENDVIRCIDLEGAEKLVKVYVRVDKQGTAFITNPDGSRQMEVTDGHPWNGTREVKAYFVYNEKVKDYIFYNSELPGQAEDKMRADGVKFESPKITNEMVNAPSKYGAEVGKAKRTVKNYLTGFLLPFAIHAFLTNPTILEGASVALDSDELAGELVEDDSYIQSKLDDKGDAVFNAVKGGIDLTNRANDIVDLASAKSKTETIKKVVSATKGSADVVDDAFSTQQSLNDAKTKVEGF